VPNLPAGALTLDNLAARLQDMTPPQMRNWANERMPSIFDTSNGGNILSDLSPFGIITRIWAEVNSAIANADPADINGPEDIPGLLVDFIEGLPVIGELIGLFEAIMGTYTGDDPVLLAVQEIFLPIRMLLALVSGQDVGIPTVEEIIAGWADLAAAIQSSIDNFIALFEGLGGGNITDVVALIQGVIDFINTVLSRLGLSGINSVGGGQVGDLLTPLQNLLGVDSPDVIGAITGTTWFGDLKLALGLGSAGLGTGSLSLPGISSIPLLGPLLSVADASVVNALTGTPWFGDLQTLIGSPTGMGSGSPVLPGITGIPLLNGVAAIDTLVQAWGGTGTGYGLPDLFSVAQNISNQFVTGVLTSPDIGAAVQQQLNAGAIAIGAVLPGVDATLAQWQSQLSNIVYAFLGYNNTAAPPPVTSVAGVAIGARNSITSRAVQNNLFEGIDPTANAVFPLTDIESLTTLPTLTVDEGTTVAGYLTTRDGGIKESIAWLGYGGTGITSANFNVYSVDQTTGQWTWVYTTPDFHAALSGSVPAWNFLNIAAANYLNTNPGNVWVAEMRITGSGTHTIVGKQSNITTYPSTTVYPSAKGAHRDEWFYSNPPDPHPQMVAAGPGAAVHAMTASYTHTIGTGTNNWYLGVHQTNSSGTLNTANITVTLGSRTATLVGSLTYVTGRVLLLYQVLGSAGTPLPTGAQTVTYAETGALGNVFLTMNSVEVSGVASRTSPSNTTGTGTTATTATITSDPSTMTFMLFGSDGSGFSPGTGETTLYNQPSGAVAASTMIVAGPGGTGFQYSATLGASQQWGSMAISLVPAQIAPATVANPATGTAATYSTDTPFFQLSGNVGTTQQVFNPALVPFDAGVSSFTPPAWANFCDIIVFGAGGGGGAGGISQGGTGGNAGSIGAITLAKAQWTAATAWTIVVGAGGTFGNPPGSTAGGPGGTSSVTVPGYGSVIQGGGNGGLYNASGGNNGIAGQTEPDEYYDDIYGNQNLYGGGGGGPGGVQNAFSGQNAAQPGGGGGGGARYPTSGSVVTIEGGYGGDGKIYLLFYQ
jgi:hypothetical protein